METRIEIKKLVEPQLLAAQLSQTNKSAAALCEKVGSSHAMQLMQIFEGQTIRFPFASTVLKAAVIVFIRQKLKGTYKGEKARRDAVKKTQNTLQEQSIYVTRQQIERIYKAKRWVL